MKNLNQKSKIKSQKYNAKVKSLLAVFVVSFFVIITSFGFLFSVSTANAATGINRQINFQGKLVDNNGLNVADSTYVVVFSLYSVSSGGTNVWTETDSVTTKAGIFQVQLGANTTLPDNVYFNQDNLYLGIKVGADAEMTPRIRFTAVPYALNAASLNGVTATQSATGFTMIGGTGTQSTLSFTTTGGALTFQPGVAEGLTLDTNGANTLSLGTSANAVSFGGGNNPTYTFNGNGLTTLGGGLTINGTSEILGNGSDSTIQTKSNTNSGLTLLSQGSGNITLGQNAGNGDVVIAPNAGGQAALIIKDMGTGDLFTASAGATSKFTIQNDGTIVDAKYTGSSNAVVYATSANGTFATTPTTSTANQCLLSGSSTPNWGACALGSNLLQLNTNALSPSNTAYDFLLGSNATTSAKFAFINNAGAATPVASISATVASGGTGNGIVLNANGSIQSLYNNSLTLGGASTGDIILAPLNGATAAYVAPNTNNQVDLGQSGAAFRNIYAGTNVIVNGQSVCLANNTNCPAQTSYWQLNTNALSPGNSMDDLLLGGNSTGSAKFAFINNAGSATPVASISAQNGSVAPSGLSLSPGTIQSLNNTTLTIGGNTTGDVQFKPGNSGSSLYLASNGDVGFNTTTPIGLVDIKDTSSIGAISGTNNIINGQDRYDGTSSTTPNWTQSGTTWTAEKNVSGNYAYVNHTAGANAYTLAIGSNLAAPVTGTSYLIEFNAIASTSGNLSIQYGGGTGAGQIGLSGGSNFYSEVVTAGNTTGNLILTPDSSWTGTLSNISVNALTASSTGFVLENSNGTADPLQIRPGGNNLNNIFVGYLAGQFDTTGANNVANGYNALANNLNGFDNVANGSFALSHNTSGTGNVANGFGALLANTIGSENIANGVNALDSNSTGSNNIGFGFDSLQNNTSGNNNIAFGFQSGLNVSLGSNNLFFGANSGVKVNGTSSNNVIIGPNAGPTSLGTINNSLYIANQWTTTPLIGGDFANGLVGINYATPAATFDVRQLSGSRTAGTLPVASISGATSFASLIVDQSGSGDLLSASSSGLTKFTINSAGDLQLGGTTRITTGGVGTFVNNTVVGTDTFTANTITDSGALAINTGASTLTLNNGGSGAVQFFGAGNNISSAGNLSLSGSTGITLSGSGADLNFTGNGADTITTSAVNNSNLALMPGGSGRVGVNVASNLLATLDVRGNSATTPAASVSADSTFAALVVNNSGTGDLFTASTSGQTQFTINSSGNVQLSNTNYNACGVLATDANGNIYCSTAGAKETIASVYTITAPSGTNLTLNFNGAAGSAPSSASGTITFPANTIKLAVQLKGAGGGGGGAGATNSVKAGGGGGEGGYSQKMITSVASTYYIKVGGGGAGGSTAGGVGGQGTATCLGTTSTDACTSAVASATGGTGGAGVSSAIPAGGGAGGVGANGDVNLNGQGGGDNSILSGTSGVSGPGGGIGGGAAVTTAPNPGNPGSNGGGGSGAYSLTNAGTQTGGNGGNGYISFTIYTLSNTASDNWYQYASGVLSPISTSTDVLIGSNATTSAKFGFLNVNSGTPTASLSAGVAGGAYMTAAGVIQTTANQSLTLGGTTTGNIILNPAAGNFVGIDTQNPLATLDVRGATGLNGGTVAVASVSGQTSYAALSAINNGIGDLFTASKSGATKFTILNNGNISWAGTTNFLNTINTLATAARTWTLPDASGTVCVSGQSCATSGTVGYWNLNSAQGTLFSGNSTLDFLIGGSATTSARFAVTNMAGGTPVASLSAGVAGGAYMTASGTIQTTANQSLTLGGTTTGNIILNPAAGNFVGIDTQTPWATLDVRGATGLNGGTAAVASVSGKTSFAGLVVNNEGSGDLLTASSAGLTKFTVTNNGNLFFGGDTISASSSGSTNNGSPAVNNALPDQGSIVPNAGFEANSFHVIMPDGWINSATSTATLAIDNTTASQGNNSLKFTIGAANQLAAFYSACFPMNQSQTYEFQYNQKAQVAGGATVRGYIDQFTSEGNCQKNAPTSITGPIVTTNTTTNWAGPTTAATVTATANSTTWGRVHFFLASSATTVANATTWIDSVYVKPSALNNGLDYAEDYPADPNNVPKPGDVVALEAGSSASLVTKADSEHQAVLGVVSTKPGQVLDDGSMTNPVPIALAGRIPVNVSTVNGPIRVGDYLTASSIPGVAVKATSAGPVIGIAMQDFDCSLTSDVQSQISGNTVCQGQVLTFVNKTWFDPTVQSAADGNYDLLKNTDLLVFDSSSSANASDSGILQPLYTIQTGAGVAITSSAAFAQATIADIQAGAIVAKQISADSLNITSGNITLGGQTLGDYIKGIIKQTLSERDQTRSVVSSVNGLITATQSAQLVQSILDQYDLSATVSGMTITGVLGANTISAKHIAGLVDLGATSVSAASISAQTITADTINAKHIAGLEILESGIKNQESRIDALESLVSSQSAAPAAVQTPAISPALGMTVLPDTNSPSTTSGDLRVKGNGLIEGILHVVDTLFANNFIANGIAEFFGNVVFHSGVKFDQTPTFNTDTAGIAVIKKGMDHIDVTFTKAYDQTPVINASITTVSLTPTPSETPESLQKRQDEIEKTLLSENIRFVITKRNVHGFTIMLDSPATEDIAFSWLAIAVENSGIFQSNVPSPTPEDNLSPSPIDTLLPTVATTSAGF